MPHPYFVPVSPTFSLIAQSSGVSSSTSTLIVLPLIVRFAIACPLFKFNSPIEPGRCWPAIWNSSNQENAFAHRMKVDPPVLRGRVPAAWLSCPFRAHCQAQETHQASKCGKSGAEHQRNRRAVVPGEGKAQGRERGAQGLSGQ